MKRGGHPISFNMRRLAGALALAISLGSVGGVAFAAPPGNRRQTLGGAYERSVDRLEQAHPPYRFWRENRGPRARINSTEDAVRRAEVPALPPRPLSEW
jgi:hypothetical protein